MQGFTASTEQTVNTNYLLEIRLYYLLVDFLWLKFAATYICLNQGTPYFLRAVTIEQMK